MVLRVALLQLTDKISTALDKIMFAIGIFSDLFKASDIVDHSISLSKLHWYGFQDVVIKWFSDYLSNREQNVCINDHISKKSKLYCGVPQGLILRLLLFLIFINDFAVMSESALPILFADDINIVMAHSDFGSPDQKCQYHSSIRLKMFPDEQVFNVNKSNYISLRNKTKTYSKKDSKLLINNIKIKQVSYSKLLDELVDEKLSWGNHSEYVCKKVWSLMVSLEGFLIW